MCRSLLDTAARIAEDTRLELAVYNVSERAAVACSPAITGMLKEAIGGEVLELASGAGHDGVYMSELTGFGMLFVRCKGGVSHNPAESVTTEDVAVALDVLGRFLELFAKR